jgi:hypothetical protein
MAMKTAVRVLTKCCYGVTGAGFLVAGAAVLLFKTGLLPDSVRDIIMDFGEGNLNTLHVAQELGSLLVFAGLITFWFLRHYEQSRPFHWAMTLFWGLIALVHWFDVRGPIDSVTGPLVNSVPFAVFVTVGLLRTATEGSRSVNEQQGEGGGMLEYAKSGSPARE